METLPTDLLRLILHCMDFSTVWTLQNVSRSVRTQVVTLMPQLYHLATSNRMLPVSLTGLSKEVQGRIASLFREIVHVMSSRRNLCKTLLRIQPLAALSSVSKKILWVTASMSNYSAYSSSSFSSNSSKAEHNDAEIVKYLLWRLLPDGYTCFIDLRDRTSPFICYRCLNAHRVIYLGFQESEWKVDLTGKSLKTLFRSRSLSDALIKYLSYEECTIWEILDM